MIGIIPYAGTSFSTYEMLKRHWAEKAREEGLNPTEPKPLQRLMFGGKFHKIRGHPHMISDFLGPFLTYLPTHIRF